MKANILLRVVAAALLSGLTVVSAHAADFYLQIEGVDGESSSEVFAKYIEVLSFNSDVKSTAPNVATGGGGGAGKAEFGPIRVIKVVDKSSPKLMLACATGKHFPKATLICYNNVGNVTRTVSRGDGEFYRVELTDVLISSVHASSDNSMEDQTQGVLETLSLNFTKIVWTYTDSEGQQYKVGYNVKTNTKL